MAANRSIVAARAGDRSIVIGRDALGEVRRLSRARELVCPCCGAPVVLRAGHILAPHFAHLPGAPCIRPGGEPETEEHRAGKALLAEWAEARLTGAMVRTEAILPSGQRADVFVQPEYDAPIALEFQCADLSGDEWRRRHRRYREEQIRDLWLLGASRLDFAGGRLTLGSHSDLERAMLAAHAPLLFLDPLGDSLPAGSLARFRPSGAIGSREVRGRLSMRALSELAFPKNLFAWPREPAQDGPQIPARPLGEVGPYQSEQVDADSRLRQWLAERHHVGADSLPAFFGIPAGGAAVFASSARLWQACIYYRFVHGRIGSTFWLGEVETWARRYLPVAVRAGPSLRRALAAYQDLLSAAGFLSFPVQRGTSRVVADLTTLPAPPDVAAAQRLAAYRRTLRWERNDSRR